MFQIAAKIQQREVANAQLKLSYQHAMEEEQTEYVERLKSLQDQVGGVYHFRPCLPVQEKAVFIAPLQPVEPGELQSPS